MQKKPAPVVSEKIADVETAANANSPVNVEAEPKEEEGAGGLSLLGIGGKQIKSGAKKAGKKRTPGEIRIQKGTRREKIRHVSLVVFSTAHFCVVLLPLIPYRYR